MNMNIAEQANSKIIEWSKDQPKLVVAIDGYTGIGKTTLLNKLIELNPDIVPVNRDNFIISRAVFSKKFQEATTINRVELAEKDNLDTKKLATCIQQFRTTNKPITIPIRNDISGEWDTNKTFDFSKKILVIEGVFLFHPELLNHLWDKRIYLEGDIKKIDERRVAREKARWGDKYFPEDHPDSYFKNVTLALKKYQLEHHPELKADLVLNVDE